MIAMSTLTTPEVHLTVLREKKLKIKISACVRDSDSRRELIAASEHCYIVTPPEAAHRNSSALHSNCEIAARQLYSEELWERIKEDDSLAAKLDGKDWFIHTKTIKITPLF